MQARYYWHPQRHAEVSEYFASVRDRTRANNMLLHLSDALVRSSMLDVRKLSAIGISEDSDFEVQRIRISEEKYPALFRLYTSSPSRLRGYIFGEVLAEAARFRKEKPEEAGMLILNFSANLEDVGDDAYPKLAGDTEQSDRKDDVVRDSSSQDASATGKENSEAQKQPDRVNGLGGDLLSSLNIEFFE